VLRNAAGPVPDATLERCWPESIQRSRVLAGLLADGLVEATADGLIGLPGDNSALPSDRPGRITGV
jgi:A/G-specific adenine glycosylase